MAVYYDTASAVFDSGLFYDQPSGPQPRKDMAKPRLNLNSLNPDEVAALTQQIITAMTGNANFTTPNPTLASLTTLKTTATTKIAAFNTAKANLQTAINDRDVAVEALKTALRLEAAYVENITSGDAVKIQSAGMSVKAAGAPIGPLPQVSSLAVAAGDDDGELDATWDPVRGAKSYQVQFCVDPITSAGWKDVAPVSKSWKTLTGLTSGARVWVRVRAIAPREENHGGWSDPAVKTVP